MIHNDIIEALTSLRPTSEWTLVGDDYSDLVWSSNDTAPTIAEIEAEIAALPIKKQQAIEAEQAARTAAEAKLAVLGLTADDLKALGL
jgi:hypothetical protein